MANVHFADVPRHVGRGKGDVETSGDAGAVRFVHIVHEDGHPDTLVSLLIGPSAERRGVRTLAPPALGAMTQKYLALAGGDGAKARRVTPIPELAPAPLLKPGHAGGKVGNVEDGNDAFGFHGAEEYHSRGKCEVQSAKCKVPSTKYQVPSTKF